MKILGIVKSSLIDYPGKASTVLFLGGCNFRCAYCHNPDIVHGKGDALDKGEILAFLQKRRKFLDGVVITGGEPTIHEDLAGLIRDIRALDYSIKLDTNGTRPEMLAELIRDGLLDYIAMDIKAPLVKYPLVCGIKDGADFDTGSIEKSIQLILESGIDHEFRTTICSEQLDSEDIGAMAALIRGARKYCLQRFRESGALLGGAGTLSAYDMAAMETLKKAAEAYVDRVVVR